MTGTHLVDYLAKLEVSEPSAPGMYLRLIHGRESPDEEMDDWGTNGPCFGPLAWCHITYMSTINLCALGDAQSEGTGPMTGKDPLHIHGGLLYYNGVYYGDWELAVHP